MDFITGNNALTFKRQGEIVRLESWGKDSLRLRATPLKGFTGRCNALTEAVPDCKAQVKVFDVEYTNGDGTKEMRKHAKIVNGRISAEVNFAGVISVYKDDSLILREYFRSYDGTISRESRCLKIVGREWKGVQGSDNFKLKVRFESNKNESFFGMGQYQQQEMNLKGCTLELAQRNSQISVPFALSTLGYGMLWNNPGVGQVTFGNNMTVWDMYSVKEMDYWITVADTPKEILASYTNATGHAGEFPEDLMGLWQCKLRYRTQDEVLSIARKYKEQGIHIDQIVIDFFHWTYQGDWKFDTKYWPDPKAMVDELHEMGIKVIVSVWPSVDRKSENFGPMWEKGLLIKTDRGAAQTYDYQGDCVEIDPFNPETREYLWNVCKKNYFDYGIDGFWLDNSEPDYGVYDFDNYRYCDGPALEISNFYPQFYSRAFYDNMVKEGVKSPVNLLRCAWAGSQKYGNVVWSGDVPSTFEALEDQLQCGINMGLAGIPWWTTDIGGFMTDDVSDPDFKQLLIRWYQFAVYTAVFRLHGDRGPYNIPPLDNRDWGGGYLHTGQDNEMWSYGEDVFAIMKKYYDIRMELKPYIKSLYDEASKNGSPLLRAMFYEFPEDKECYRLKDQYMFGDKYLVAPILHLNEFEREVYLPEGNWKLTSTGETFVGGQRVKVKAPIEYMPVFEKE
ncbi:MAG: glycoside hydrolase family 31 protein [Lachnospiraceae bacterium]|nr:glycoside hydrolase family 31 protein [Lachnospiraceae bacterium]